MLRLKRPLRQSHCKQSETGSLHIQPQRRPLTEFLTSLPTPTEKVPKVLQLTAAERYDLLETNPATGSYKLIKILSAVGCCCCPGRQLLTRGLFLLEAEGPVGLHQRVNVARSLVNDRRLAVAPIALDRIVV